MRVVWMLFVVGLCMRCLFWLATPDRTLAWSHACKGDAPLWQQLAADASAPATPDRVPDLQLRLPLRPPAMQWCVALVWDGNPSTAWRLRLLFVALGALVAPLLYLALRREIAERTAAVAAAIVCVAGNLVVLSSGLHVETPYLVLLLLSFLDWPEIRGGPRARVAARWAALHASATLLRAEHPLCFLLLLLLAWRQHPQRRLLPLWPAAATFLLLLAPVQWHAMQQVATFNTADAPTLPPRRTLPWDRDALAAVQALPAFQQLPVWQFVDDTARVRGRSRVTVDDLQAVTEAYGCWPEPLHLPLLTLYGPLNFFLANNAASDGGFSNAALRAPPPLRGGPNRYPPGLLQVLPLDGRMTPDYPPHLQALEHGYALGLQWLQDHPADALPLAWRKLQFFWQGAASGVGGYSLPMGLSGTRRQVDLVTADGALPALWRLLLLALCTLSLWRARRRAALAGWLAPLATGLLANVLFFGYARLGALAVPTVALLLALLAEPMLARCPQLRARRLGIAALLTILLLEVVRALTVAAPRLDGRDTRAGDPFAPMQYAVRSLDY